MTAGGSPSLSNCLMPGLYPSLFAHRVQVYVYHKAISTPMVSYSFTTQASSLQPAGGHAHGTTGAGAGAGAGGGAGALVVSSAAAAGAAASHNSFISSLCWRRSSRTLLAANSQGRLWVLGMVP